MKISLSKDALRHEIVAAFLPFDPEKIILFGSRARGEWDDESDIDVIVVYETAKTFMERLKELYLAWNVPKAVDILAYTLAEFERMRRESPFVQEALRQGEVLYEKQRKGSEAVVPAG